MTKINREILSVAVPSIITNITTPLLALMDVVIVGHMGGAAYLAAISVGGTIFNMLYWLFAFLRMGSSGLNAIAHGASDDNESRLVFFRGLSIAFTVSVCILLLQIPILRMALKLLDTTGTIGDLTSQYFRILIWGAPASLSTYVLTGWLLGMKNARLPMWISFVINITNIIVSLILVYIFGMKVAGVATGTLVAQWSGFIFGLAVLVRKYHPQLPKFSILVERVGLKRFFSVNSDIFFRTLCLITVTVWFTRVGASQGTVILAVNTLLMQFFILFSYFMDGFAYAGESLCGNFSGKGDSQSLHECIKALFRWSIGMVLLFTIVYAFLGESILGLISDDTNVLISAKEYAAWAVAIPAVGFAAFTWDGIYIGLTHTREMLWSMAISTVVYFLVLHFTLPTMGNHGLWLAFLSYLLSRGIVLSLLRHKIDGK